MKLSKEDILLALNEQLQRENEESIGNCLDDPGECLIGQENTSRLVIAINLLEQYEWDEEAGNEEVDDDEVPF